MNGWECYMVGWECYTDGWIVTGTDGAVTRMDGVTQLDGTIGSLLASQQQPYTQKPIF